MSKLIVDPEIRDLLPPRSEDEAQRLKDAILLDGCREPLVRWKGQGILLDGHGRHEICTANKVKFTVVDISLPNRAAAIEWVVNNQLAKRNLTDERRAYYIGKQYLNEKKARGGQQDGAGESTAAKIGQKHGVNEKTVRRAALFAKNVDELPAKTREAVLDGKTETTQKEVAATPPGKLFCDRCTRLGPTKGCNRCDDLRKAAKKPAREPGVEPAKKKSASGKVKFDWRQFDDGFGLVLRQIDKVGNAYNCKESPEAEALRDDMSKFRKSFTAWYRKVAGLDKDK